MLPVPGKSSGKCGGTTIFCCPAKLLKMSPLVDGQSAVSTLRKWGQRRRVVTGIRATALLAERASQYSGDREPVFYGTAARLASCSAAVPVFPSNIRGIERFVWGLYSAPIHSSSFRFWGAATSGRLGRVTVLPQLKVDRLCSVVDGTAEFDPQRS